MAAGSQLQPQPIFSRVTPTLPRLQVSLLLLQQHCPRQASHQPFCNCKYVEAKIVRQVSDEDGSPGFRSSSGDEDSRASQKRKKLRKKKERKAPGNKDFRSPEKASPEKSESVERKARKSPEKSLEKMRQRLQKQLSSKELVERKGSVGEERRPSIARRQSVTNYDLADVLRKNFKPFKIVLTAIDISLY